MACAITFDVCKSPVKTPPTRCLSNNTPVFNEILNCDHKRTPDFAWGESCLRRQVKVY